MPWHATPDPQGERIVHVEFRLDWITRVARLEKATPDRRLNAIENLLTALTKGWREGGMPILAPDIRLSGQTCHALAEWVQLREPAVNRAAERLLSLSTGAVGGRGGTRRLDPSARPRERSPEEEQLGQLGDTS
jgi:hypothetical protein